MRPDRIDHRVTDLPIGRVGDQDVLELRIGRTESYSIDILVKAPDVEFPLHLDHDNINVRCLLGPVNHQQVVIVNALIDH